MILFQPMPLNSALVIRPLSVLILFVSVFSYAQTRPTQAETGPDQAFCGLNGTTLQHNLPGVNEEGFWNIIQGSGDLQPSTDTTTDYLPSSPGVHILEWSIWDVDENFTADTVVLTFEEMPPVVDLGSDYTICEDNFCISYSNTTSTCSGMWSLNGPGIMDDPSAATTCVSGLIAGQITELTYTISCGQICPESSGSVEIERMADVTEANAGLDYTECEGFEVELFANFPNPSNGETGTWSVVSGCGNFSVSNDPYSSFAPCFPGIHELQWCISNGLCAPKCDGLVVTIDPMPSAADAGVDSSVCLDSIGLYAVEPSQGSGSWSVSGGNANIQQATNPNSGVKLNSAEVTLTWTTSTGGVCPDESDDVFITHAPSGSLEFSDILWMDETEGQGNGSIEVFVDGGSEPYEYDWNNDGTGDFDDEELLEDLSAGTYTVEVRDADGCVVQHEQTIENAVVGLSENRVEGLNLKFLGGELIVEYDEDMGLDNWEIASMTGKVLSQGTVMKCYSTIKLSLGGMESGMYLLNLGGVNGTYSQTFIK